MEDLQNLVEVKQVYTEVYDDGDDYFFITNDESHENLCLFCHVDKEKKIKVLIRTSWLDLFNMGDYIKDVCRDKIKLY